MRIAISVAALMLVVATEAGAHSVAGSWDLKFYLEPNLRSGAVQNICLKPDYTWYSPTYPGWRGAWFLKGDRLRISGLAPGFGTGMFGTLTTFDTASGEYQSYLSKSGRLSVNANWRLVRVKEPCEAPAAAAVSPSPVFDPAVAE